ncbi:hypothetical protein T02_13233 [Trichinella nativa]|uniref:Uncharacterized protein n=1 Tax=Trichinella nativa TaxID=6335 RepID=A0A0V1KTA6_9BILA|nr:hypothetical protein T02_13233 [Trichinella nativa]
MVIVMSLSCISMHKNQRRNEEYICCKLVNLQATVFLSYGGASNDYAYCVLGLSQTGRFSQTVDCDDV